jgi:translation initiation factor IF-3
MKSALPVQKDGPRINEEIRSREVQLIDSTGDNKGVVEFTVAMSMAEAAGLDLVEISPNSNPPVVKILDFGKYKFQAQKKAAEARKKQKVVEIKEIKLRPMIDDHDYQVKMRSMQRFFEEGDKVKITLRFRGREMAHQEFGFKKVQDFIREVTPWGHPDSPPKLIGKSVNVMLSPLPRAKRAKNPHETEEGRVIREAREKEEDEAEAEAVAEANGSPKPNGSAKQKPDRVPTNGENGNFGHNPFNKLDIKTEKPDEPQKAE